MGEYSEKKFYKVGDVVVTARTDLGSDWALCNGASFTSSQYPELSGVMGNLSPELMKFISNFNLGGYGEIPTKPAILDNGSFVFATKTGARYEIFVMKLKQGNVFDKISVVNLNSIGSSLANVHFTSQGDYVYCVADVQTDSTTKIYRINDDGSSSVVNNNIYSSTGNVRDIYYLNGGIIVFDNVEYIYYNFNSPFSSQFTRVSYGTGERFYNIQRYNNKYYLFSLTGTYGGNNLSTLTKVNNIGIDGTAIINDSNGSVIYFPKVNQNIGYVANSVETDVKQQFNLRYSYGYEQCIVFNNMCYFLKQDNIYMRLFKRDFAVNTNQFTLVWEQQIQGLGAISLAQNFSDRNKSFVYIGISNNYSNGSVYGIVNLSLPNISLDKVYAYIRVKSSSLI